MDALSGIKVVDFSTLLPGPLAGAMLRAAGAEVVKVERPPHGDELRAIGPQRDGQSAFYRWLNDGKQVRLLDLKSDPGRAEAIALAAQADVLIEQFRPGVMERLGLGWEALRTRNPRLVYCSISGYGAADARSLAAGHDLNYQAEAGLVEHATGPGGPRAAMPMPLAADISGGSYPAVMNILLALHLRERTGRGARVDVSMFHNLFVLQYWAIFPGMLEGAWPRPFHARHTGGSPRYNLYPTRDGRLIACAALEDRFWGQFLSCIGLQEHAVEEDAALIARIGGRMRERDAAEWMAAFAGRDACCALVLTREEAWARLGWREPAFPLCVQPG